jgi:hypothetical protein
VKKPDYIVYDEDHQKYDANIKYYPTTVGSQKFEPIVVDKSDVIKADKYFNSRLEELKREYETLLNEYDNTKLVYTSEYNFQPIVGEIYHLYEGKKGGIFLSIIKPNEWKVKHIGSFRLLNNGVWEEL